MRKDEETEVRCQMSDVGCRMSEVGGRMSDVRCRMSEVGGQYLIADFGFVAELLQKKGAQRLPQIFNIQYSIERAKRHHYSTFDVSRLGVIQCSSFKTTPYGINASCERLQNNLALIH